MWQGGLACCSPWGRKESDTTERLHFPFTFLILPSTGLQSTDSVVGVQGPSCSVACRIFLDQGLNPCPLHWQVVSYHCTTREVPQLSNMGSLYFEILVSNFSPYFPLALSSFKQNSRFFVSATGQKTQAHQISCISPKSQSHEELRVFQK